MRGQLSGFAAGAESAHPHIKDRPAGEGGDFAGALTLQFKEREHESLIWSELAEDAFDKRGRADFALVVFGLIQQRCRVEQEGLFSLAEIGGAEFRACGLVAMTIAADVERDARDPMLQRLAEVVAGEMVEDANEGLLHKVFNGVALREMRAHDPSHTRVQTTDEFACGSLAAAAQPGACEFVVGVWIVIGHWTSKHGASANVTKNVLSRFRAPRVCGFMSSPTATLAFFVIVFSSASLLQAQAPTRRLTPKEFQRFDKDGDGQLNDEEKQAALTFLRSGVSAEPDTESRKLKAIEGVGPVSEVRRVHSGFQFTEGPAADAAGNVYFTDPRANVIYISHTDGRLSTFLEDTRGANGLMFDAQGRLVVCQGGEGRVVSLDVITIDVKVIADRFDGQRFNAPNDLVLDAHGGVYFTDPAFRAGTQDKEGVYHVDDKGAVTRVIDDLPRPNGILISADGKTLFVLPSGNPVVMAYPVEAPGRLGKGRMFAALERSGDGMTMDSKGNLYVTQPSLNGIVVLSGAGEQLGFLPTPESPSNCTFGGADMKTLFITARTSLYAYRMEVAGHGLARQMTQHKNQ